MGQYFTPQPIAELMASITQGEIPKDRLTTILDPCVGSGVMILASIQKTMEQQPNRVECLSVTEVDLDYTCARMFPLQVLANGLIQRIEVGQLVALHGNALDNPNEWQTTIEGVHRRWYGSSATPSTETIKKIAARNIADKPQQPNRPTNGLFRQAEKSGGVDTGKCTTPRLLTTEAQELTSSVTDSNTENKQQPYR